VSGEQEFNVAKAATLARLNLTDEESAQFQEQLGRIINHVDALGEIDVEGIEPTAHPAPVLDRLREDVAGESLSRESVMRNAPDQALNQIRVPKVVDAS
jgi:aspartyl-tRNA(Asn)/glutamyl-tRNA(Gln) amidotransferase subunit C